jgi:hypothetical protein
MMQGYGVWFRLIGAVSIFTACIALAAGKTAKSFAASHAVPDDPKKDDAPAPTGKFELSGYDVCQRCHVEDDPTTKREYQKTLGYDFIRLWENKVWENHDLHQNAYQNLLTKRSAKNAKDANATAQKMEDNLIQSGSEDRYRAKGYTVATDILCLACHTSVKYPLSSTPANKWTDAKSSFSTEGVGCEMCHGHGSQYQDIHQKSRESTDGPEGTQRVVDWREWPPETKSRWGLVNLRDPIVATERCASCHIGNVKDGRFVTHEMFAAGHPPLPPFDLIAYSREMPRHWGLPSEMPYLKTLAEKNPKKAFDLFHIRNDESHVARRFAESTVGVLLATALNTSYLAEAAKSDGAGLDFAAFDCYSCHHDLKYPSERQARGYAGKAGRPLLRPAPFALARLIVQHASNMEHGDALKGALTELQAIERELTDAFASRSLGDPAKVVAASDHLAKWSKDCAAKLGAVTFTRAETRKLLDDLIAKAQSPVADPEVAQLYFWAFETLVLDLSGHPKIEKGKELPPPKELVEFRKALDGVLVTRLRPNVAFYYEKTPDSGKEVKTLESVDSRLQSRMKLFNNFQFEPFSKAFTNAKLNLPK